MKHSMIKTFLIGFALFAFYSGQSLQATTNTVVATNRAVTVNTNGTLLAPTNFFTANSNLITAVVGAGTASGVAYSNVIFPGSAITNIVVVYSTNSMPTNAVLHLDSTNGNQPVNPIWDYYIPLSLSTNISNYTQVIVVWPDTNGNWGIGDAGGNDTTVQPVGQVSSAFYPGAFLGPGSDVMPYILFKTTASSALAASNAYILFPTNTNYVINPTNQVPFSPYTNGSSTIRGYFVGDGTGLYNLDATNLKNGSSILVSSKNLNVSPPSGTSGQSIIIANTGGYANFITDDALAIQQMNTNKFMSFKFLDNNGNQQAAIGVGMPGAGYNGTNGSMYLTNTGYFEGGLYHGWIFEGANNGDYAFGQDRTNGDFIANVPLCKSLDTMTNWLRMQMLTKKLIVGGPLGGYLVCSNAPDFEATNAGTGITVGTTAPKLFIAITNNGVLYKIPAY